MLAIQGKVFLLVQLKVGDSAFLLNIGDNRLKRFRITESCRQHLPELHTTIHDTSGAMFHDSNVYDGVRLSVSISLDPDDVGTDWIDFTVHPTKIESRPNGPIVHLSGYLSHSNYLLKREFASYEGTSAKVVSTLAVEHDLLPKVDSSIDSQVWLRTGESAAVFVKKLSSQSFAGKTSMFVQAVTRKSELRYYNISQRREEPTDHVLFVGGIPTKIEDTKGRNFIQVPDHEWEAHFQPESFNSLGGYGINASYFNFVDGTERSIDTAAPEIHTDYYNVNTVSYTHLTLPTILLV